MCLSLEVVSLVVKSDTNTACELKGVAADLNGFLVGVSKTSRAVAMQIAIAQLRVSAEAWHMPSNKGLQQQ